MIKQRFLQLLVIALCCAVTIGCKEKEAQQAEESPIEEADTSAVKYDSGGTDTSLVLGTKMPDSITHKSKIEEEKENEAKPTVTATIDSARSNDVLNGNNNRKTTDSAKMDVAVSDSISPTNATLVDSALVDSLWKQLIVDVKIMSDTSRDDTNLETLNRDSVFMDSVFKKAQEEKLDSLVQDVIVPPSINKGPTEPNGWLNWINYLSALMGLLLGALLAWLVSWFFYRKKKISEPKEEEPKLKMEDYSDLGKGKERVKEFLEKLIIK